MQRFLYKKLPAQLTVDEYIETEDTHTMLMNFFARWQKPERPPMKHRGNTEEEMQAYLSYLRVMTDVYEQEELLLVTTELLTHHSDAAKQELLMEAVLMEENPAVQRELIEAMDGDDLYDGPSCSYL